jgi:hypothetical protein
VIGIHEHALDTLAAGYDAAIKAGRGSARLTLRAPSGDCVTSTVVVSTVVEVSVSTFVSVVPVSAGKTTVRVTMFVIVPVIMETVLVFHFIT